ncbi:bifunctional tRNA (5-methylaminomethyl-2-thiouridine)(34)-methyltransferase MnmD/FAD-dependent 5-carboxymethylaminomethyl-2-thiouridine(34) oxidoreductase MnmC [Chitinilyticum aquatile]|uniref:bifunctional tRNA (5-methylaminomethyl-2-thiouridine)(34)-methyltransferase MnmD/FAD-dependent 5-carboxymethylaminomethyl-2-thiouridine(34) oxidoreductase MnmC n=1 Tax=Chitinilyticum aquatile TaxID=362520 RepID=UPI00041F2B1D|nr:bifunctional tRNA (5-methylaminomethyl-2-thiouridine)(34)-methyltransferase MnmD/FAD-dependent 5-carboxymethylaminomethyl-2-thiouridine(34) oxidoreductase MnmC [Chitinilyticum aquatile]
MTILNCAPLEFSPEGIPYSSQFDDIYHSRGGGLAQAREVFMAGNGLPQAWQGRTHFTVLETGFGQGLSFLATWQAWKADPARSQRLHFVSVEQYPFRRDDLALLHAHYPEIAAFSAELCAAWPWLTEGIHRIELAEGRVILTLVLGNASQWLPELQLAADAIYLDGFAPDKNPGLWCPAIYRQLRRLAHDQTTLATYTVAGHVRRGLADAGFAVERIQGFAGKRQMLRGQSAQGPRWRSSLRQEAPARSAVIVGAGMAGASAAWQLARRGWEVSVLEAGDTIAGGSSGNHVGLMHPTFSRDDNLQARLTRAGCEQTLQALALLEHAGTPVAHGRPGHLQIAKTPEQDALFAEIAAELQLPGELAHHLDQQTGSQLSGQGISAGGLFYKASCWIHPPGLCTALLHHPGITVHTGCRVAGMKREDGVWLLSGDAGEILTRSETVILANATAAAQLCPQAGLPLTDSRRVVTRIAASRLDAPEYALSGPGYLTPGYQGLRCAGAAEVRDGDVAAAARKNLQELRKLLPRIVLDDDMIYDWRDCSRPASPDRLPLIGQLPAPHAQTGPAHQLWQLARLPGLYGALGFGSRGLTWAILAGDLLGCLLNGEPLPLERKLLDAVDPGRFALRQFRKQA